MQHLQDNILPFLLLLDWNLQIEDSENTHISTEVYIEVPCDISNGDS